MIIKKHYYDILVQWVSMGAAGRLTLGSRTAFSFMFKVEFKG